MEMPIDMQHQAMGYDRTATMFSPEGTILQVEYAEKTARLGSASIGMVCSDGVFILADKRIKDKLVIQSSANKIYEIDSHIIVSAAGIVSDARVLIERAQVIAQQHRITYDSPIEPELVIKDISNIKQQSTQYGGARPFGTAILLGGVKQGKAHLYTSDVTGNFFAYKANAIGENDEKIKEILRRDYREDITIEDGIKFVLKIFKTILDKNFELQRFDIGYISTSDEKLTRLHGDELKKYLK